MILNPIADVVFLAISIKGLESLSLTLSLKYLRSTTLGYKYIRMHKSEKTIDFLNFVPNFGRSVKFVFFFSKSGDICSISRKNNRFFRLKNRSFSKKTLG